MPTNKQRRDANRVRLQRQLEARRESEARRRKFTLITSIGVTVVLIAAIVITVVAVSGSDDKRTQSQAGASTSAPATTATSPAVSSSAAAPAAPVACAKPASGAKAVTFKGVTVKNPTDLKKDPQVTSTSSATPAALECQDLVVGTGKAATATSNVKVQYAGVLYKNGTAFDSSWSRGGSPAEFSLTGVVPGFTQGIGGTGKVAPMKVGGRRIIILPAALGYGDQATGSIPANSSLVFVVDLTSVS